MLASRLDLGRAFKLLRWLLLLLLLRRRSLEAAARAFALGEIIRHRWPLPFAFRAVTLSSRRA
jgi:hypothetical protein